MSPVAAHTPIQYIMGSTEFFGLDLLVDERALIPRPETEFLVQAAIDISINQTGSGRTLKILDLCTGSGNIAISLTKHITNCKIIASDISGAALDLARQNADRCGVLSRIDFEQSDLFNGIDGFFDIIVSNPPYVARPEFSELQREVLMEPRMALDGGEDGLDFYRKIIDEAPKHLSPGGYLALEIGYGQLDRISGMMAASRGLKFLEARKDQNNIDRIVLAQWINY